MNIASNATAREYDRLQKTIDWRKASDTDQVRVMTAMLELLALVSGWTPIFDFGGTCIETGAPIVRTAADQADNIRRRISRFT